MRLSTANALLAVVILAGTPCLPGEEKKLDRLIVYGEGFAFGVKEPAGWKADTKNAATLDANILFYRPAETIDTAIALIKIRIGSKVDENTAGDLAADMDGYKSRYPGIQFRDLDVSHGKYRVFSKLFTVPDQFYEYVVYLNPGKQTTKLFSVSMNKEKLAATREELAAFSEIVGSVELLSPDMERSVP